jgi:NADH:ubiquinone oxidoreductase subunit 5 (subunit L)/multisubunit Na+/H+ antiporter MnhA subunit
MVMTGAVQSGPLWVAFVFLVGACLTIIYLFRVFNLVFLGDAKTPAQREGSAVMVISVAALAGLSLAGGIFIYGPSQLVLLTIKQLPGVIR